MGRELKRVPMDFDWPIDEMWKGYNLRNVYPNHSCEICQKEYPCLEDAEYCIPYNPEHRKKWFYEPPVGEGYQMWENTSEGSPQSPVFKTLEELCAWLEETRASWFAGMTATKEQWYNTFLDKSVGIVIVKTKTEVK
jgi:hypothetical protein